MILDFPVTWSREIFKKSYKKDLEWCKIEYDKNSNITWDEVKKLIMNDLVAKITLLKVSVVLPV